MRLSGGLGWQKPEDCDSVFEATALLDSAIKTFASGDTLVVASNIQKVSRNPLINATHHPARVAFPGFLPTRRTLTCSNNPRWQPPRIKKGEQPAATRPSPKVLRRRHPPDAQLEHITV